MSLIFVSSQDFFVVAANIACESGVLSSPEVSFREPRPAHSMDAYPEIPSTGKESDMATASPENRLNAPGPAVAKHTPSLLVCMA